MRVCCAVIGQTLISRPGDGWPLALPGQKETICIRSLSSLQSPVSRIWADQHRDWPAWLDFTADISQLRSLLSLRSAHSTLSFQAGREILINMLCKYFLGGCKPQADILCPPSHHLNISHHLTIKHTGWPRMKFLITPGLGCLPI